MASKYPHIVPGARIITGTNLPEDVLMNEAQGKTGTILQVSMAQNKYTLVRFDEPMPRGDGRPETDFAVLKVAVLPAPSESQEPQEVAVATESTEEQAPEPAAVVEPPVQVLDVEVLPSTVEAPAPKARGGLKPSTLALVEQRRPSWSTLATQFEHGVTAREALEQAGLQDEIIKAPMFAQLPDGDFVAIANKFAMVNPRTGKFYGPASSEYTFLQNDEVAAMLDQYITSVFPVIGAGNTPDGSGIMFVLDAGSRMIAGEEIHQYFIVAESRTVGISFRSAFTPLRPFCQNTLLTAFSKAFESMSARHDRNIRITTGASMAFVANAQIQARQTMDLLEAMTRVQIGPEDLATMTALAFPYPGRENLDGLLLAFGENPEGEFEQGKLAKAQKAYNYWSARAQAMRDLSVQRFENFGEQTDQPHLLGTVYAAYQAIVEVADFGVFKGSNLPTVAGDSLYGVRATGKVNAMNLAQQLVLTAH